MNKGLLVCPLSSVRCRLAPVTCHLSSVLRPLSSEPQCPTLKPTRARHWVRLIAGLVLLGMAAYAVWQQQRRRSSRRNFQVASQPRAGQPERVPQQQHSGATSRSAATIVAGQTIHDQEGRWLTKGTSI